MQKERVNSMEFVSGSVALGGVEMETVSTGLGLVTGSICVRLTKKNRISIIRFNSDMEKPFDKK